MEDDVAVLDQARLTLITRGSAALAAEFLQALIEDSGVVVERLTAAFGVGERGPVADLAHSLKGMATELGALRLRAAAAALEAETDPAHWASRRDATVAALEELRRFVNGPK